MEKKCKNILIAHYLEKVPTAQELENLIKKIEIVRGTNEITFKYKNFAILLAENIIDVFKFNPNIGEYENIERYEASETYENIIKNF